MNYGKTNITHTFPWGLCIRRGTRLLCSDGKVRSVSYIAQTADTFFSIPCAIRVRGHYVTGYATGDEQKYIHGEKTTDFLRAYTFQAHTNQKDNPLPDWPSWPNLATYTRDDPDRYAKYTADCASADSALNALIASVHAG